ncbi:galectin-12 isoform X2 [Ambystoma mexicanum]|uniref:galectin-12 isoform X2 n=1 Tax=Ambystoma mexicanum TaxID=8296 RepID=UPI0037E87439
MEPTPGSFLLQPPVFHPVLPYMTTIFGGLYHGKQILVQGMVLSDAERFQVDFQCGCSTQPGADIAFHFNPRFHSSPHVICNTLEDGKWQSEKKCPKLPLKAGDHFQLLFRFERECIKVSVSGHHFVEYTHRLPLERVDTLGISGDVAVKVIGFINSNPLLWKSQSLTVPYTCRLTDGLKLGQMITVRGLVAKSPEELVLTLNTDAGDVPLKLSACFKEQALRCNSFLGRTWELEEKLKLAFSIFYPERFVEILLLCEAKAFKVAINGFPLGEYCPSNLDLKLVSVLQISGDIELYSVHF